MNFLDDTSLEDRVRPILDPQPPPPTELLLRRATELADAPWPADLERMAQCLGQLDELAAAGLSSGEIIRVCLRPKAFESFSVDGAVLSHVLAVDDGLPIARALCEELAAKGELDHGLKKLANAAVGRLAAAGEFDPRFDALFSFYPIETSTLRAILAALPADRREAAVLARATPKAGSARSAAFIVDRLLDVADLVPMPSVSAARDAALAAAEGDDKHAALTAEIAANTPRARPSRPTPRALESLEYWLEERAREARAGNITSLAEQAYERAIHVAAPELASLATWAAAGEQRQRQIARQVADELGGLLDETCAVELASFGGPPIAVIDAGTRRFCLVPGGEVEVGLSAEEEALVRARAEANAGVENHYELYEQLFENLHLLRPAVRVRVGPLLVQQGPGDTLEPEDATEILAESPLRVPSEAEWEHLARGGKSRELTYRGNVVPDHEAWFEETQQLGVGGANAFGLWGFGYEPELCADQFTETHAGLPTDGTPRRGEGPRVVRGGAAQLYPWQSTGEWQMLLSAFRMPHIMWEYTLALRFVLGVDCGVR